MTHFKVASEDFPQNYPIGENGQFGRIFYEGTEKGSISFKVEFSTKELFSHEFLKDILEEVSEKELVIPCGQNMRSNRTPSGFWLKVASNNFPANRSPLPYIAGMIEQQFIAAKKQLARMEAAVNQVDDGTRYILGSGS